MLVQGVVDCWLQEEEKGREVFGCFRLVHYVINWQADSVDARIPCSKSQAMSVGLEESSVVAHILG